MYLHINMIVVSIQYSQAQIYSFIMLPSIAAQTLPSASAIERGAKSSPTSAHSILRLVFRVLLRFTHQTASVPISQTHH